MPLSSQQNSKQSTHEQQHPSASAQTQPMYYYGGGSTGGEKIDEAREGLRKLVKTPVVSNPQEIVVEIAMPEEEKREEKRNRSPFSPARGARSPIEPSPKAESKKTIIMLS